MTIKKDFVNRIEFKDDGVYLNTWPYDKVNGHYYMTLHYKEEERYALVNNAHLSKIYLERGKMAAEIEFAYMVKKDYCVCVGMDESVAKFRELFNSWELTDMDKDETFKFIYEYLEKWGKENG